MLPIRSRTAKLLTNFFGGDIYRLYDSDSEGAVPKGEEFDGNFLYGIEKPQWNDYIESELGTEYLYAKYIATEAASKVVNDELNYVNNTDGLSNNLFNERLDLREYLKDRERPSNERLMLYMEPIVDSISERIYSLGLEQYGWDESSVTNSIIKNIEDEQLREELESREYEKQFHTYIDNRLHEIAWIEEAGGTFEKDSIDDIVNDLKPAIEESIYDKSNDDVPFDVWYDSFAEETLRPYLESKAFDVDKEIESALDDMSVQEAEEFLDIKLEDKPKDYLKLVRESVAKEYKAFVDYEKTRTQEQLIHEDNYKIRFFNELSAFIEEDAVEQMTDRDLEALYMDSPHILDSLYDYYLGSEYVSINNYDDTMELIEYYNDRYHEEIVEDRNEYEGYRELPDRVVSFGYDQGREYYYVPGILTEKTIDEFQSKSSQYIVAARSCALSEEELKEKNVTFLEVGKDIQEQDISHKDVHFYFRQAYENIVYGKLDKTVVNKFVECKKAIEKGISENFDGMHLEKGFEDDILKQYGLGTVKQVLALTVREKEYDGRFSPDNKAWANEVGLVDVGSGKTMFIVESHPAVLDGFINRIRVKEKEEEKGVNEMAEETAKKEWIKVNVSDEALINKYEKHSFMRMPTTSEYDGYTYNIYNDRISKGIMTTDLQSDSRETSLFIRLSEDEKVLLKNKEGNEVVLTAKEFKAIVDETASKEYERKVSGASKNGNDWTSIILPRESVLGMYEKSVLFATPNSKMSNCSFYVPNAFVDENKENEEGTIRVRVPNDFEFSIKHRESGHQYKFPAQQMKELFKNTTEEDFARESYNFQSDQDETKDNDGWKYVSIDASAKIVEYEKSTLFRMPKGEYEDYCFYMPNELLRENKEKGTYRVSIPEDFTVHLKNNRAELDSEKERAITTDDFIKQIKGKGAEEYASEVKSNGRGNAVFEKVEKQLIENVPKEMKEQNKWVIVRTKVDDTDGKLKKFLIDCHTGKFAKSDDPNTWSSFDEARKYATENGGVALAYALDGKDGICCIDVDHCVDENGKISDLGRTILSYKDKTLCEKSVSGNGVHLFGKTKGYDVRVWSKDGEMEFYQDSHFITMTGDDVVSKELMDIDASPLRDLIAEKFATRLHYQQGVGIEGLSRMNDRDVVEKAMKSKNGQTFEALYKGEDLQNNHSNSDMKFMNMLAFWCNGDKEQMYRIFRTSGLYRAEKSDSYVECTIMKAIRDVGGRFQPQQQESSSVGQKPFKSGSTGNSK